MLSSKDSANLRYILRVLGTRCPNSVCVGIRCAKSCVKFSNVHLINDDVFFTNRAFIDYVCKEMWRTLEIRMRQLWKRMH